MRGMTRRGLTLGALLLPFRARAQQSEWFGTYSGAARFHRSIPLENAHPPRQVPQKDRDDGEPFGLQFALRARPAGIEIWLRIDAGPMQTTEKGETLHFGPVIDRVAHLVGAEARPIPRTASLTILPGAIGTEALFSHADNSFWRRHFTARFSPTGADVILWVFDAAGTRARNWRGSTLKQPP